MLAELGLEQITNETIVDLEPLLAEVAEVRRKGWARQRRRSTRGFPGLRRPCSTQLEGCSLRSS